MSTTLIQFPNIEMLYDLVDRKYEDYVYGNRLYRSTWYK